MLLENVKKAEQERETVHEDEDTTGKQKGSLCVKRKNKRNM